MKNFLYKLAWLLLLIISTIFSLIYKTDAALILSCTSLIMFRLECLDK